MDGINRICIHWTAGTGKANSVDKSHYHYLVQTDGSLIHGDFKPEDNINCKDGKYAAHAKNCNTGTIGIALCGMLNYVSGKPDSTKYPLTAVQCEATWKLAAELCKKYNIEVREDAVFTHYEFEKLKSENGNARKIDINYLPYQPQLEPDEIGDFIRNKIQWYLLRI